MGGEEFRHLLKKAIRVASTLLFISFFVFLGHHVYAHLLENPSFRVREVEVTGCQKIPRESLLSLASIEGMPNLFTLRLKEIARRLEAHPWIEGVRVEKAFPNKILIAVEERKPIAILQLEDLYYVDAKGVVFSRVGEGDGYNYPFLTGLTRQAMEKESDESKRLILSALDLLWSVEKERRFPLGEISEIHVDQASGIQCFSKAGGIEVQMGWDRFPEKLQRLSLVWDDLQKKGVSAVRIDCSDINRMVVRCSDVNPTAVNQAAEEQAAVKQMPANPTVVKQTAVKQTAVKKTAAKQGTIKKTAVNQTTAKQKGVKKASRRGAPGRR
jgi:cell division protein FtsQ